MARYNPGYELHYSGDNYKGCNRKFITNAGGNAQDVTCRNCLRSMMKVGYKPTQRQQEIMGKVELEKAVVMYELKKISEPMSQRPGLSLLETTETREGKTFKTRRWMKTEEAQQLQAQGKGQIIEGGGRAVSADIKTQWDADLTSELKKYAKDVALGSYSPEDKQSLAGAFNEMAQRYPQWKDDLKCDFVGGWANGAEVVHNFILRNKEVLGQERFEITAEKIKEHLDTRLTATGCTWDIGKGLPIHIKLICFNRSDTVKDIVKQMEEQEDACHERYSPCRCFKDFVYHELAHALCTAQLNRGVQRGFIDVNVTERIFSEKENSIKKDVGLYAWHDVEEFVAEAFVMLKHGNLPDYCRPMFPELGEK